MKTKDTARGTPSHHEEMEIVLESDVFLVLEKTGAVINAGFNVFLDLETTGNFSYAKAMLKSRVTQLLQNFLML